MERRRAYGPLGMEKASKVNKSKNILLSIATILMVLAILGGWPYGFYTFLRITIFSISIYLVVILIKSDLLEFAWAYGFIGLLFNPLIPFHLGRSIWLVVDFAALVFFVYSIFKIHISEAENLIKT
jgi:hypothetical protein